jgi:hypothetical protein
MDTFRHLERHQVRVLMFRACPPERLNPSLGLGLPSQSQFIIRSSFHQEKLFTSALVPRVFLRVSSFGPRETVLPFISFQTMEGVFLGSQTS